MKCVKCGNVNQPDAVFCDQCGARLSAPAAATPAPLAVTQASSSATPSSAMQAPVGLCPQCGASNTPGEMFCDECGAPLDAPAPEAAAVAPPVVAVPLPEAPTPPATPEAASAPVCPKCGAPAEPGDAFCAKCGAALVAAAPVDALAQAAPAVAAATVIAPEVPTAPATLPQSAPTPLTECPSCGADVNEGDAFCDFCGAALVGDMASSQQPAVAAQPVAAQPVATQAAVPPRPQAVAGGPQLVVVASGAVIPLPETGLALIGREDPLSNTFPEVDLTPHGGEEGGVSRRHCQITLGEGQYAIQDLNSTNSTWLNRTRLQPGLPVALHDGDEIRAGRVALRFRAG